MQHPPPSSKKQKAKKIKNRNRDTGSFPQHQAEGGQYAWSEPSCAGGGAESMPYVAEQCQYERGQSSQPAEGRATASPPFSQQLANPSHLPWRPKGPNDVLVFLDLTKFKTQPCPFAKQQGAKQHNPKRCFYYHDFKKDRRRGLGTYTSEICPEVQNSRTKAPCSLGDACLKAHNRVEEFYHPEKYKSKFCQSYPHSMEGCDYGEMCAFAHTEDEISIDLLHKMEPKDADFYMFYFKTVWCPWSADHDKEACVYAHNWQDLRRKPHLYSYNQQLCLNWQRKNFIKTYGDGCCKEYRCSDSHGWKEQQYHPRSYKLLPCKSGGRCKKQHCPNYHSEADRRIPFDTNFILMPRNRGNNFSLMNPHLNQYKPVYIEVMQKEQERLLAVQQTIYGCGPQSVPAIEPFLLGVFQAMEQQKRAQPLQPSARCPGTDLEKKVEKKPYAAQIDDQKDNKEALPSPGTQTISEPTQLASKDLAAQQRALQQLQELTEMKTKIDASYNYIQAFERQKYIMQNSQSLSGNSLYSVPDKSYDLTKAAATGAESLPIADACLSSSTKMMTQEKHLQLKVLNQGFDSRLEIDSKHPSQGVGLHPSSQPHKQHPLYMPATEQPGKAQQQLMVSTSTPSAAITPSAVLGLATNESGGGAYQNQKLYNMPHFNELPSMKTPGGLGDYSGIHHTGTAPAEARNLQTAKGAFLSEANYLGAAMPTGSMVNPTLLADNALPGDIKNADDRKQIVTSKIRPNQALSAMVLKEQPQLSQEQARQSSTSPQHEELCQQTVNTLKKSMNDILKDVQASEVEGFCSRQESPRTGSQKQPLLFSRSPKKGGEVGKMSGVQEEVTGARNFTNGSGNEASSGNLKGSGFGSLNNPNFYLNEAINPGSRGALQQVQSHFPLFGQEGNPAHQTTPVELSSSDASAQLFLDSEEPFQQCTGAKQVLIIQNGQNGALQRSSLVENPRFAGSTGSTVLPLENGLSQLGLAMSPYNIQSSMKAQEAARFSSVVTTSERPENRQ